jgi:hypothetical protein
VVQLVRCRSRLRLRRGLVRYVAGGLRLRRYRQGLECPPPPRNGTIPLQREVITHTHTHTLRRCRSRLRLRRGRSRLRLRRCRSRLRRCRSRLQQCRAMLPMCVEDRRRRPKGRFHLRLVGKFSCSGLLKSVSASRVGLDVLDALTTSRRAWACGPACTMKEPASASARACAVRGWASGCTRVLPFLCLCVYPLGCCHSPWICWLLSYLIYL